MAVAVEAETPVFLTPHELETLRAVVDRFIPGPPEDPDPGAVEAGCAEAIDALLGAFAFDPPRIYAGGPFSDRAGSDVNHFAEFVPLDAYETAAWRLRIEGSRGRHELERNGPVQGWQEIYRAGLAALDEATDGTFASMPAPSRELLLRDPSDDDVAALVDVAFPHTLQAMYGPPEYGGNRGLVGWAYTNWDGDVQPRGWTREEVEEPDQPGLEDELPELPGNVSREHLQNISGITSPEVAHGLTVRARGSLGRMREQTDQLFDGLRELEPRRRELATAIEAVARQIEEASHGR